MLDALAERLRTPILVAALVAMPVMLLFYALMIREAYFALPAWVWIGGVVSHATVWLGVGSLIDHLKERR